MSFLGLVVLIILAPFLWVVGNVLLVVLIFLSLMIGITLLWLVANVIVPLGGTHGH